ncbi:MAG TPA: UDP-N-acetylmuramoyl-tripeptide--D-alanyl-D-alanine ligase [Burkholderiales bacterium]|nr:UDP-N-acetylmuramoyl-tripeptide--D-alanyl-D-alanine ligase [Burkholderiales bacterium]
MFKLSAAARAVAAELCGDDAEVLRVSTDSRAVREGDLFVALRGERFDGNRFVAQAFEAGAAAAMVSDPVLAAGTGPLIVVEDTRLALGRLAAWWRSRFDLPLIAITGSNGKTTVKEMLAAVLRRNAGEDAVLATAGNLNNDIGVPLTLLSLREQHRYAVVEMGMNHVGEIAWLSRLARPTVALINNAGTAHIGEVGSVEAVARAKGEIFEGLAADGVAVINGDDAFADYWRSLLRGRRIADFGLDRRATVTARYELENGGSLVTVRAPDETFVVRLFQPGVHNVRNALAAVTAAWVIGVPSAHIAAGLAAYKGVKGRLQRVALRGGSTLLDDSYNANPESIKAALAVLGAAPGKKIFVIGDMGELGEAVAEMHAEIGAFARRAGVDRLLGLGVSSAAAVRAFGEQAAHFETLEKLIEALERELEPNCTVLVKGSRFMRMERVTAALQASADHAEGGA